MDEDPGAYVIRLAREKAQAVFAEITANGEDLSGLAVLGADTTVTLDGQILGKPVDAADAARMLRLLSGRTHRVLTGIAVVTAERTEAVAEATAVTFLTLTDERSAHTLRLASRWTRPELMPSRGARRGGFRASRAATSMWSGCRLLWSRSCLHRAGWMVRLATENPSSTHLCLDIDIWRRGRRR